MKFARSGPALLIVTSIVVILVITLISNVLNARLLTADKEQNFKLMRDVLASNVKNTEDKAVTRAEIVTAMPSVKKAFIAGDRPKLLAECEAMFKEQDEKYGVDQGQFHVPPGISFLRLHNPTKFGDDQTSYRPMLSDAHASKSIRKGVALTKSGPAINGVVPLTDDAGKFVGSFEMGLEFPPMLARIKEAYGIDSAAFFDDKRIREIGTDMTAEELDPNHRVGKYLRYHATHNQLMAALVTEKDIDGRSARNYERTFAGTLWGVQLVPMYDYANHPIGVYALAANLGDAKAAAGRALMWNLLAALFGIVILIGLILVVVRGVVLAPIAALGERMASLAAGDASRPADPPESYCAELRGLAESYESLRASRQPREPRS